VHEIDNEFDVLAHSGARGVLIPPPNRFENIAVLPDDRCESDGFGV
jgi:hypothetical protein